MARELTFKLKRKEYRAIPVKIERKKLYGWTEILALDDKGDPCNLVNTDESGRFIIPKGGTGLGILSPKGEWVERSELKTVTENGSPAKLLPSSFNTVINLKDKVSVETFLDYSITDFYELQDSSGLAENIGNDIYSFSYSYLENYEGSPAFIMASDDSEKSKSLFMLIGMLNVFEMLCFGQCGNLDEEIDDMIEFDDSDDLDFSMFN